MSKLPEQIIAAAKGKIDEEVLSAAFAKPRGSTTAAAGAGMAVSEIGARWTGKQRKGKEILSTVPLGEVDSVEVSRMGLAGVMRITSGENSFKLEGKVGDMREFAEAFDRAKATA